MGYGPLNGKHRVMHIRATGAAGDASEKQAVARAAIQREAHASRQGPPAAYHLFFNDIL